MASAYRIADEPLPGALASAVVHPVWPLFAVMFAGAWFGWPWFLFNGYAVGSPTRRQEFTWAVAGALGLILLVLAFIMLLGTHVLPRPAAPYAIILLSIWKLGISYKLFMLQSRTYEIYEYFGGRARNGLVLVAAIFLLYPPLLVQVKNFNPILAMLMMLL